MWEVELRPTRPGRQPVIVRQAEVLRIIVQIAVRRHTTEALHHTIAAHRRIIAARQRVTTLRIALTAVLRHIIVAVAVLGLRHVVQDIHEAAAARLVAAEVEDEGSRETY